jgi:DnaJ-domain-containing protein 1
MSEIERLGFALRAWVGQQWDRIQSLERQLALDELNSPSGTLATSPTSEGVPSNVAPRDHKAEARMILGVEGTAPFDEVRAAYLKLYDRSHPDKFSVGSDEHRQAEHIQRRVQWAYGILTADVSDSEKRFRSLEIE